MTGTYNGRRSGINVSSYIDNLNSIVDEPLLDLQDDANLAMFSNTSWFDFDMGQPLEDASSDVRKGEGDFAGLGQKPTDEEMDFINDLDNTFGLSKFSLDNTSGDQTTSDIGNPFITPTPPPSIGPIDSVMHSPTSTSPPAAYPYPGNDTLASGKRKASTTMSVAYASPQTDSFEEASRLAAEEDKRRRNTAASARFRVKKKQREQALERSAKEMSEKVRQLEQKVNQLELENKWLKNLIVEKKTPGGKSGGGVARDLGEDFAAKFSAAIKVNAFSEAGSMEINQNKDSVGTLPEGE